MTLLKHAAEDDERRRRSRGDASPTRSRREVRVAARPETVFPYFTDPAKMVQWKGIEADARPAAGRHLPRQRHRPRRSRAASTSRSRRTAHRLHLGLGGRRAIPPGSTTVEVELIPDGDDTIVRLTHADLSGEALDTHVEGWEHFLPRLAAAASGADPGPDPWATQHAANQAKE